MMWRCLLLRLIELSETCVFVLRKKHVQVSDVHVYHHISTASLVWIFIKYFPSWLICLSFSGSMPSIFDSLRYDGQSHIALINTMVHIVMCTYYLLTSFKQLLWAFV